MRCHYLSDLHLERHEFRQALPRGDVLIIAGDLCNASALDPARTDLYRQRQRDRVLRFIDGAMAAFAHVILVAGNHEHHDGVFDDTVGLLKRHLAGVNVLDDDARDIGGVRYFGSTLWSDCDGRSETAMNKIGRGMGEYFFTKVRNASGGGLAKLRPADTLAAHGRALRALRRHASAADGPLVVITHHAPSRQGLNPRHKGSGLDGAYASDLEELVRRFPNVPYWVHGHTHVRTSYAIGRTTVLTNGGGFESSQQTVRHFDIAASGHTLVRQVAGQ